MSTLSSMRSRTITIALIAIFSALYAALRIIPTVPMIGTGAAFRLSDILAPLYGILLGPLTGGISIIIGTFAALIFSPSAPFLGLDFLPAFVVAISLGFLVRRKWLPVVILNAALLVGYAVNPLTSNFILTPWGTLPYLWLHLISFVLLLSPLGRKACEWIKEEKTVEKIKLTKGYIVSLAGGSALLAAGVILLFITFSMPESFALSPLKTLYLVLGGTSIISSVILIVKLKVAKLTIGFAILALIGTMMQHLMGGILYEVILGQVTGAIKAASYPGTWNAVFYVYPWERLALIIGALIIGIPVTRVLRKTLFSTETKQIPNKGIDTSSAAKIKRV